MNILEEMKNLAHNIISSYLARIEAIENMIDITHKNLEDFKVQREKMSIQLRQILANAESLRKKDFDNMMKSILSHQDEREKEVREIQKNFLEEHKRMASKLKEYLFNAESSRIEDFKALIENLKTRQDEREKEVRMILNDFQKEQQYLTKGLRELLAKGEQLRIKDFKAFLREIQSKQRNRKKADDTRMAKLVY
ncbi:MAG: hypothetical protein AB1410_06425 [Acidobacteriota bacterium]